MRSISRLACLIATARLTVVDPDLFLPSSSRISHRHPMPSVNCRTEYSTPLYSIGIRPRVSGAANRPKRRPCKFTCVLYALRAGRCSARCDPAASVETGQHRIDGTGRIRPLANAKWATVNQLPICSLECIILLTPAQSGNGFRLVSYWDVSQDNKHFPQTASAPPRWGRRDSRQVLAVVPHAGGKPVKISV
jgi:hypothetical protein